MEEKEEHQEVEQAPKDRAKRKCAVHFGYVGAAYYGLQHNNDPVHPSIEQVMIDALNKCGFISDENLVGKVLQKTGWQRASRTDKGVSALRNVVSATLVLPVTEETLQEQRAKLNETLPKDIHVYAFQLTTGSFNSYLTCTGRRYQFLLPTYALLAPELYSRLFPEPIAGRSRRFGFDVGQKRPMDDDPQEAEPLSEAAHTVIQGHRISNEQLERARLLFSLFIGTNSFHNYTPQGEGEDSSCTRFITDVTVSDPQLVHEPTTSNSSTPGRTIECVRIQLDGQSFMLNQIRKIIGCVIVTMASGLDGGSIRQSFDKNVKRHIPIAPANGLYLDNLHFEKYNLSLQRIQSQGGNAAGRTPILPETMPEAEVNMVHEWICTSIGTQEIREGTVAEWMRSVRSIAANAWLQEIP